MQGPAMQGPAMQGPGPTRSTVMEGDAGARPDPRGGQHSDGPDEGVLRGAHGHAVRVNGHKEGQHAPHGARSTDCVDALHRQIAVDVENAALSTRFVMEWMLHEVCAYPRRSFALPPCSKPLMQQRYVALNALLSIACAALRHSMVP